MRGNIVGRQGTWAARRAAPLALVFSTATIIGGAGPTVAQTWRYWLEKGSSKVIKCPGETAGRQVKLANQTGQWIELTGSLTCKDQGQDYLYQINFVKIVVNSSRRSDIEENRDPIKFDWIGIEVYKPDNAAQKVDWMFGDAKPIDGALPKNSTTSISFGNISFAVPKARVDQATHFTLFLTAQGIPFTFGQL